MATVKFNVIADMRGKINGTVYSRNRSGNITRNLTVPINPQTSFQTNQRASLSALASAWRSLTQTERDSWSNMADQYPAINKVGESYIPSGYQLYMTLNGNLDAVGQSTIDEPALPGSFDELGIDTFTVASGVGTIDIQFDNLGSDYLMVYCTGSLSQGINRPGTGAFKLISTLDSSAGPSFDITTNYETRFGDPIAGAKVFTKVFQVNTTTGQKQLLGATSATVS